MIWLIGRRCTHGNMFSRPVLILREAWPYFVLVYYCRIAIMITNTDTIGIRKGATEGCDRSIFPYGLLFLCSANNC